MCAYSVFNTFPVYPLSAKPLILLAFCRYRYHTSLFNRPDFQRMMEDVENGIIETIVVKDMSRFGRNYILVGQYVELVLPQHHVRVIGVTDNYDSYNTENDLFVLKVSLLKCMPLIFPKRSLMQNIPLA